MFGIRYPPKLPAKALTRLLPQDLQRRLLQSSSPLASLNIRGRPERQRTTTTTSRELCPLSLFPPIIRAFSASPTTPTPQSHPPEPNRAESEAVQEGEDGRTEFTLQLTPEELQDLTKGDEEVMKKVRYIQLEHEVYRQEGLEVPSKIKFSQWKELLALASPNSRKRYYRFMYLNEMTEMNKKRKQQEQREKRLQEFEQIGPEREEIYEKYGTSYGLNRNTLWMRLYDTTVNRFHNHKVVQAMVLGRPLVLDCSYEEHMSRREAKNCAKQLELLMAQNRLHKEPFCVHLCNLKQDSYLADSLYNMNPALKDESFPAYVTEKSYLEVFPKKNLVYLTPHAREEMEEFSEDDVYIVGAMVDKSDPRPFSLAKAKKEGLRMMKLPLDKYLMWGLGSKSLTINQMVEILLDVRFTRGDWRTALKHVPMRKLNRDFHPYPNQINDRSPNRIPLPSGSDLKFRQSARHENKSKVLEDFDLIQQRRGFKGFNSNQKSRNSYSRNQNSDGRLNARRLMDD